MLLSSESLRRFLVGRLQVDPVGLDDDTPLFSSGLVDSFGLVDLVAFIEAEAGVRVEPDHISLDHFDTLERILAYASDAVLAGYVSVRGEVLEQVRGVLIDALRLRVEPDEIDPDTPLFGTGLGLDSIDALELVVAVEHAFGVRLADSDDAPPLALRTVNTIVDRILACRGVAA